MVDKQSDRGADEAVYNERLGERETKSIKEEQRDRQRLGQAGIA